MDIAAGLEGSFLAANVICGFLRANMHNRFWRKVLELERTCLERNILLFGKRPQTLLRKNKSAYIWCLSNNSSIWVKFLYYETHSPANEVPKIMVHDVQTISAKAYRKLDVLVWRSAIPPYHS
jgi:hypothetical protein